MKVGILRENKTPPDKRAALTPEQCIEVQQKFPDVKIMVQPSAIRCFADNEYAKLGVSISEDRSDCDILMGVKEERVEDLIEGKKYLIFSHVIKKQPYNRELLQTILKKNIELMDYEVLTNKDGSRIIGFGRFAGLVGAYSGLRAFGIRNQLFGLKPAHECENLAEMLINLDTINLPPLKIAVTGDGRVANGVVEIMNYLRINRLAPEQFLKTEKPDGSVYTQLLPENYVRRKNGHKFDLFHFFLNPTEYENAFLPFAETTDLLLASAYWDPKAPVLFTPDDMKSESFRISVISDITCDIQGSIPSTKRASTIENPFYDYNPQTEEIEPAFTSKKNITVQAVDNLPCELPKDASLGFGRNLINKVFPSLFGEDTDGIIERATITKNGKLTQRFSYLQGFVDGE
ncbi:MAG: alanine dehydrogenase/pnt domain [Prolixibacteraceae bacterium]|nr:MAG: alanine dehydrogenase/pnt domain [Prolixibacteraceae bacterium]